MTHLTKQAVERVLGPTDEATAAELASTGATEGELAEASAWLENDEALVNEFKSFPSGRVAELVEILEGPEAQEA